jgi:hypothetical protein
MDMEFSVLWEFVALICWNSCGHFIEDQGIECSGNKIQDIKFQY